MPWWVSPSPGTCLLYTSGQNEILRISHTAFNRDVFAVGALAAARYLVGQKPGLYNMKDLIKK